MTTTETLLVCTVGGSHQPIVTAIETLAPCFVCFICSGRDPATGKPGSETQILGQGKVIKAHPADPHPSLPNIPTLAGLATDRYQVECVPADDLDQVHAKCSHVFGALRERFPDATLLADYTGGTKTMTAGLVLAALDAGVELSLVTGNRADLVKVRDGSQALASANVEGVRLQRDMGNCLRAWEQYGYAEAAAGLASLAVPRASANRSCLLRARELSRAFAAWDRFDHAAALTCLQDYAGKLDVGERALIGVLQRLLDPRSEAKRTAALLLDLYRNAERRAAQGRYDDAVGRVYRLIEWTAQWLLKRDFDIDTADVPATFDVAGTELTVSRDGKRQAALTAAWKLVERRTEGPAAVFITRERSRLLDHLRRRNGSILAHGFKPVPASDWGSLHDWLPDAFMPMLLQEASTAGVRELPPQLPRTYQAASLEN
ncbi:MAG: TIGR02710 family CRISPR-associated protein [Gammaproteobacteria bacterium]|nr:TIGR02710 family CRISPR-associated protein [Gammaproteobacteria bacterium]